MSQAPAWDLVEFEGDVFQSDRPCNEIGTHQINENTSSRCFITKMQWKTMAAHA